MEVVLDLVETVFEAEVDLEAADEVLERVEDETDLEVESSSLEVLVLDLDLESATLAATTFLVLD